ncbi:MAG: hypothetical protein JXR54_05685 [Tannerellaceae bacterium]|nr:hypothetical protein [uncultured Macellibacteroides sp.]MBN2660742.1 hypothetical protein [Tannerellaceae bacterium]MBP7486746.1 hypothetical protein [Parabacteroides sp.]MBP8760960.1 hypothetical protein [Parabacteroides sp.]MBP9479979.1 hypothetical protein [Parabacteroides sp.]MBP9579663.1 hypothetical protein [Parabacteroides sp.]
MRDSKLDKILTIVFMVLAIAAVVCYFALDNKVVFLYCGGAAVVVRLTQYFMRFTH